MSGEQEYANELILRADVPVLMSDRPPREWEMKTKESSLQVPCKTIINRQKLFSNSKSNISPLFYCLISHEYYS